ncbi:MAG TPA: SpoIIE family protein phosphatase [Phycisphaerae bacterium]|nr:SpoIIE family protein phosphatase [Phycisphaerae bacterium]
MRLLVKEGDAVLADLTFEEEEVRVGSDPACAVVLPDQQISPNAAIIAPTGHGGWHVERVGSAENLLLNDQAVGEQAPLTEGDVLVLQNYLIEFHLSAALEEHVVEDARMGVEELAKIRKFPLPAGSIVKRHFEGITMVKDQLDLASDLGVRISHCRDIHELIDISLGLLLRSLNVRMAWIGIRLHAHGELEVIGGRLPSGQPCDNSPLIPLLQYRCCERGQHICIRKVRDQPEIGSAMGVPLSAGRNCYGMIYVDRRTHARRFQIPDLDLLTAFGSAVTAKLNDLMRLQQQREAAISASEVSIIQAIQAQLDPKQSPNWPNFKMAAYSRSGQETPGDVFDVVRRPDTEVTAFLVGHARASGASLALALAQLHSTFRVAMLHNDPPHAFARELNWLMYSEHDPVIVDEMCVLLDAPSGKIQYCRAGKIGAFVVDPHGQPRKLPTADGPSVGAARNYEYLAKSDTLAPGETLAIYTRGVATAVNEQGEKYREARFIEMICDGFGQPPATTIQDISEELTSFFSTGRHPDDITIILLQRQA